MRVAIGHGLAALKREGDGCTPRGRLQPVAALVRDDRGLRHVPIGLPKRPVRPQDGWCDAPAHWAYNRHLRLPAAASHETLMRADGLYDVVLVADHNQLPRVRHRGSAIFVHVAGSDALPPTAGCLAFARAAWHRRAVPTGPFLVGCDPRPR